MRVWVLGWPGLRRGAHVCAREPLTLSALQGRGSPLWYPTGLSVEPGVSPPVVEGGPGARRIDRDDNRRDLEVQGLVMFLL